MVLILLPRQSSNSYSSIDGQTISPFNPNPQTGYMQNTTCSLSLDNTGNVQSKY